MNSETKEDDGLFQPSSLSSRDIRQDIITEKKEYFGDQLKSINQEHTLRIGFININGLPLSAEHPKNKLIYNSITNKQIGILGLSEINKCWHKLKEKDKWRNRSRGWWECSHSVFGYNKTENELSSGFQPGGTANICIENTSHRVITSGVDPSGLGRWVWTLLRGKHNVTVRVISAYRPCKPSGPGPNTTFNQQQRYLDRQGDVRCPRAAILEDLGEHINNWRNIGDQIILMADFNENVEGPKIQQWIQQLQLTNAISKLHQIQGEPTFHRGQYSIDGIFVSHTIQPLKGGYLPFGAFSSDHRALWFDISMHNAFGYNPPKSLKISARRLKSDHPAIRNKWLDIYEKYIRKNNLHTRQFHLEASIQYSLNAEQVKEYEDIRKSRLIGMKLADRGCRNLPMGNVPFSAKYKDITNEIELWRAVITKKKNCKYSQSKLRRLEKMTGIKNSLHLTLEEAKDKENEAFTKYWEIKSKAREIRNTFLENKAKEMEKESNIKQKTIITQMIAREKQREASRRIKATLKKIKKGGITKVDIENTRGEITELTTKHSIEEACMEENKQKFMQTSNTPCMKEPLRSLLGKFGETAFAQSILEGQCDPPPTTPQYTKELFTQLKRATPISNQTPQEYISKATFQQGWKKMKEYTSSGISGIHFGHLKSCAMREFTAQFESSLSHIPYLTGYSPQDWNYGVNVMIQKKDKVNLVSKLRTITLTEADFNFNNKYLGKQTLHHAEKNNFIAKEQYGSRKGKSAIEHSVHKRLTFDIIRQLRMDGAICSNDAKSCYDRIIHSIASLAFQRLGVPFPPVHCMLKSIQNMKHHIRTAFGDSAFTMDNTGSIIPFQGALQGNGASPATWVIISTPLLNMLREAGNGGHFVESISKKNSHFVGYAFVDDTDLIQFDARDSNISTEEIMDKMQDCINRWEGGLKATGGAIVPQKSFVYPIAFEFNEAGDWQYKKVEDIDYEFTVPDHNDNIQNLAQLEVSTSKCTLGVFLAPDGNNKEAIKQMRLKSEEWSAYIKTGHLNRQDAWLATESTIMKSLLYPLAALTLTEKECNHIIAPVLDAGLRSSAICKNFPRSVAYGPREESGLNLANLHTQQGLIRIGIIKDHLSKDNMMGDLLRNTIEAAKIEIGVGRNLFSLKYKQYHPLLTDTWIKDVWKFADENNIEIVDKVTKNLKLHRQNDVFLMEIIVNQGYTKGELHKINKCRLYLQVTALSDITCGYGNKFTRAYNCIKDDSIPHYYKWPKQPRPNSTAIKIWRKALRECFPRTNGTMEYTLGNWLYPPNLEWKWYYSEQSQLVYQRHGFIWRIWRRNSRGGNLGLTPRFKYDTNGIQRDMHSVRATILRQGYNRLILTGWKSHDNGEPFVFSEQNNTNWILHNTIQPQQYGNLLHSIENGTAVAVSDGSYLENQKAGSAGWVLEDDTQSIQILGSSACPGAPEVQCSHRSELTGLLGIITHVNALCQQHNINQGQITIGCDGKGAIQSSISHIHCTSSYKHFDLISSIQSSIAHSKIKWNFQHIKGHQDDILQYEELTRMEQLNVATDHMAKTELTNILSNPNWERRRPQNLPYELVEVFWKNQSNSSIKISSCLTKTLTTKIQTQAIRQYWKKKSKFSDHNESQIDWITSQKSRKGLPTYRQRWLSKWMTGFCGTGKMLKIYRFQKHSKCPRCQTDNENTNHVLQCNHLEALTLWDTSLTALEEWMLSNNGHPELVELIILGLTKWHNNEMIPLTYDILEPDLAKAWSKQRRIGWTSFIEGFWVTEWRSCQTAYLKHINSHKSSTLWTTRVQRRIWHIAWNMWDHRNKFLHNEGKTIHIHETTALNEEITEEWTIGLDQLDPGYSHLFNGDLNQRLEDTIKNKLMWISSVWSARDNDITIGPIRQRNQIIVNLYDRWKKKMPSQNNN